MLSSLALWFKNLFHRAQRSSLKFTINVLNHTSKIVLLILRMKREADIMAMARTMFGIMLL